MKTGSIPVRATKFFKPRPPQVDNPDVRRTLSHMITSKRSIEFAWLAWAGIPGDIWCAWYHICIDGHLYHKSMPRWRLYADFVWVAFFVAAAVAILRSDVPSRLVPFSMLLFLAFSRLLLASGGGGLFIFELPFLIYIAIVAVLTIRRYRRQKQQQIVLQNKAVT